MKNKKTCFFILSFISIFSSIILLNNNKIIKIGKAESKTYNFNFDHNVRLNKNNLLMEPDELIFEQDYYISNEKYIKIEMAGAGSNYQEINFAPENNFLEINRTGSGDYTYNTFQLDFHVNGVREVSWEAAYDKSGYGSYSSYCIYDVYALNDNGVEIKKVAGNENKIIIESGKTETIRFYLMYFKSINFVYINFIL